MGIGTVLTAAMKHVSWDQVANIAMQYGPDIIRKLKERLQSSPGTAGEGVVAVEQLEERVEELERALLKQEEIIQQQNRSIVLLEENGRTLQARLNICMAMAAVSFVLSLVLSVLLMVK